MLWYFYALDINGSYRDIRIGGKGYVISDDGTLPKIGTVHDWNRSGPPCGNGELLHGKLSCDATATCKAYGTVSITNFTGWYCDYSPETAIALGREDWAWAGWVGNKFCYHKARKTKGKWEFDVFSNIEITLLGPPTDWKVGGVVYKRFPTLQEVYRSSDAAVLYGDYTVGDLVPPPMSCNDMPRGRLDSTQKAGWSFHPDQRLDEIDVSAGQFEYPYGMDDFGLFKIETGIWPSYGFFPSLASAAYQDGVSKLPEAECNTLANILDCVKLLKSLCAGYVDVKSAQSLLSESWLAYRYAYKTTVSDINEYAALANRLTALCTQRTIKTYGMAASAGVQCRCTTLYNVEDILPSDTLHKLQTWGLKVSAVNAWDLVPYSFVVDWFFHISDILESMELYGKSITLKPVSVITTFHSYTVTSSGADQESFLRVFGRPPLHVRWDIHEASDKTIISRLLDTGALLFGG